MVATAGAAVGLLLGGVLTSYAGWRWNFFINVPVGEVMSVVIARVVPLRARGNPDQARRAGRGSGHGRPDGSGVLPQPVSGLGLAGCPVPAGAGRGAGPARPVRRERAAGTVPAHPAHHFKNRNVSGANLAMAAVYAGNLGMFFLITLYLQLVEHYSAIGTGIAILPVPVVLSRWPPRCAG